MPNYMYVAKDMEGKTHKGTLELPTRALLIRALRERDLILISVDEQAAKKPTTSKARVKPEELMVFSRQLATLIDSGIPMIQSLDVLGSQVESIPFRHVLKCVRDDVETGSNLSEALGRHPGAFSTLFVNMVEAGELSGRLDEIFDRLAVYLEKSTALRRKIQSAMMYPAVVSLVAGLITMGLLMFVIPRFKEIFESLGSELPAPTQMLLNMSDLFRAYFWYICAITVGGMCALSAYVKTATGCTQKDRLLLQLPIFGPLFQKVAVARFARTLATLVRAGVPILQALDIVAKTAGNKIVEAATIDVRASIREGERIADPLGNSGVFPPMVVRMVAVGEETGELEKMLGKISDFYENEVDVAVAGLTSMIEPLVIAVLGVVIGGIVLCLFLPIFGLTQAVQR